MTHRSCADLIGGAVGNVSTVPEAVDADLLELGSRGVGVEPLPGIQNHLAGRQLVQGVLRLGCWLGWLITISLQTSIHD